MWSATWKSQQIHDARTRSCKAEPVSVGEGALVTVDAGGDPVVRAGIRDPTRSPGSNPFRSARVAKSTRIRARALTSMVGVYPSPSDGDQMYPVDDLATWSLPRDAFK
jgi:hypothetical protein